MQDNAVKRATDNWNSLKAVHGNKFHIGTLHSPYSNYLCRVPNRAAVRTAFNIVMALCGVDIWRFEPIPYLTTSWLATCCTTVAGYGQVNFSLRSECRIESMCNGVTTTSPKNTAFRKIGQYDYTLHFDRQNSHLAFGKKGHC